MARAQQLPLEMQQDEISAGEREKERDEERKNESATARSIARQDNELFTWSRVARVRFLPSVAYGRVRDEANEGRVRVRIVLNFAHLLNIFRLNAAATTAAGRGYVTVLQVHLCWLRSTPSFRTRMYIYSILAYE